MRLKINKLTARSLFSILIGLLCLHPLPLMAEQIAIIVNKNNNYSEDEAVMSETLKQLYLKQLSFWPNGVKATPVGRKTDFMKVKVFNEKILGMNRPELEQYWLGLKQKTGATPPVEILSTRLAVIRVVEDEGAFTFIDEDEIRRLPVNVRVLMRIKQEQLQVSDEYFEGMVERKDKRRKAGIQPKNKLR